MRGAEVKCLTAKWWNTAGVLHLAISMQILYLNSSPILLLQKGLNQARPPQLFDDGGVHSDLKWMNGWLSLGVMPSVEEAGRVLQSSLAQGYSMSQTIPGQRLHAVMEHGWHVSGSNGSQSRTDGQTDGQIYNLAYSTHTHTHSYTHTKGMGGHISEGWGWGAV